MQKWEYMTVVTSEDLVFSVNGEVHKDFKTSTFGQPKGKNFTEFLIELGQQGWELVAVNVRQKHYFKRPIA